MIPGLALNGGPVRVFPSLGWGLGLAEPTFDPSLFRAGAFPLRRPQRPGEDGRLMAASSGSRSWAGCPAATGADFPGGSVSEGMALGLGGFSGTLVTACEGTERYGLNSVPWAGGLALKAVEFRHPYN